MKSLVRNIMILMVGGCLFVANGCLVENFFVDTASQIMQGLIVGAANQVLEPAMGL